MDHEPVKVLTTTYNVHDRMIALSMVLIHLVLIVQQVVLRMADSMHVSLALIEHGQWLEMEDEQRARDLYKLTEGLFSRSRSRFLSLSLSLCTENVVFVAQRLSIRS